MSNILHTPSRRTVLAMFGASAGDALLSRRACAAAALNIYSWPSYFSDADLAAYTKLTGVTPNISNYNSNDVLFAKLNSPAGAGFDIVIPSSSWMVQLRQHNLLHELDHSRLDLSSLDPTLLGRPYDPLNRYSIPKDWGVMGVVYDPAAVGGEIVTWQDFLNAGARPPVSGKVRLSEASWEVLGMILWLKGKDWNKASVADINDAATVLLPFMPHVGSVGAFDPNDLANGSIVMAQCNQSAARAAITLNPQLRWAVPGPMSELWVDCYAIARNAPDLDQAYDFIAYQLHPEVQLRETAAIGFPGALAGLRGKISPGVQNADLIFGGKGLDLSKLTAFIVNPATIGAYLQAQVQLQAAMG
jgi:spermidine/putrescine transport system substrate-binding protein